MNKRSIESPAVRARGLPEELHINGQVYRRELPAAPVPVTSKLSLREQQISELIANGLGNKQVADRLRISEHTVSTHLRRAFAKLGVGTRAALVSAVIARRQPST